MKLTNSNNFFINIIDLFTNFNSIYHMTLHPQDHQSLKLTNTTSHSQSQAILFTSFTQETRSSRSLKNKPLREKNNRENPNTVFE